MLKTFVCFYLPEEKVEERQIDSRDIRLIEIPSEAYAYQFYDMQVTEDENNHLHYSDPINESSITFISAFIITRDELKELIKEMEEVSCEKVIVTPIGEFHDYDDLEDPVVVSYADLKKTF